MPSTAIADLESESAIRPFDHTASSGSPRLVEANAGFRRAPQLTGNTLWLACTCPFLPNRHSKFPYSMNDHLQSERSIVVPRNSPVNDRRQIDSALHGKLIYTSPVCRDLKRHQSARYWIDLPLESSLDVLR
jgi:hypothetical protein